jgi:hypothetical protein
VEWPYNCALNETINERQASYNWPPPALGSKILIIGSLSLEMEGFQ